MPCQHQQRHDGTWYFGDNSHCTTACSGRTPASRGQLVRQHASSTTICAWEVDNVQVSGHLKQHAATIVQKTWFTQLRPCCEYALPHTAHTVPRLLAKLPQGHGASDLLWMALHAFVSISHGALSCSYSNLSCFSMGSRRSQLLALCSQLLHLLLQLVTVRGHHLGLSQHT